MDDLDQRVAALEAGIKALADRMWATTDDVWTGVTPDDLRALLGDDTEGTPNGD